MRNIFCCLSLKSLLPFVYTYTTTFKIKLGTLSPVKKNSLTI